MVTVFKVQPSLCNGTSNGAQPADDHIIQQAKLGDQIRGSLVELWDLEVPDSSLESDTASIPEVIHTLPSRLLSSRRIGNIVGKGRYPDVRTRVKPEDVAPGGKYYSIVKIIVRFKGSDKSFSGTGLLIQPDVVVTAGHIVFDWDHSYGYATAVTVIIGYCGEQLVEANKCRQGKTVAVANGFLQTANGTDKGDVALTKLASRFDNVVPIRYQDTPVSGSEYLGIVGFPIDKSDGWMYESWVREKTIWNLGKANGLLKYDTDLFHGNSGSPVLIKDTMTAIGVHVGADSDFEYGSCIGPLGNKFEDLFETIRKVENPDRTFKKLNSPYHDGDILNHTFVSFPGSAVADNEALPNGNDVIEVPLDGSWVHKHEKELDDNIIQTINFLLTNRIPFSVDSNGSISISPEKPKPQPLSLEELIKRAREGTTDTSDSNKEILPEKLFSSLPARLDGLRGAHQDMNLAPLRADQLPSEPPADQKELPTAWFIGFPMATLTGVALEKQIALQNHVNSFWADATMKVERTVQLKKETGELDRNNLTKVASYRARVFDYYLRCGTTWMQAGLENTKAKDFHLKQGEFHTALLLAVLEGIAVPETALLQLENVIKAIGDGILKVGKVTSGESVTFWISMTMYNYQPLTSTVECKVRTILFESNENTFKVTLGKNSLTKMDLTFNYQQYDAVFNNEIFSEIIKEIDADLIKKGIEFSKQTTLNVPV